MSFVWHDDYLARNVAVKPSSAMHDALARHAAADSAYQSVYCTGIDDMYCSREDDTNKVIDARDIFLSRGSFAENWAQGTYEPELTGTHYVNVERPFKYRYASQPLECSSDEMPVRNDEGDMLGCAERFDVPCHDGRQPEYLDGLTGEPVCVDAHGHYTLAYEEYATYLYDETTYPSGPPSFVVAARGLGQALLAAAQTALTLPAAWVNDRLARWDAEIERRRNERR